MKSESADLAGLVGLEEDHLLLLAVDRPSGAGPALQRAGFSAAGRIPRPACLRPRWCRCSRAGCSILDAQQFDDTETGSFFMRVVFDRLDHAKSEADITAAIEEMAQRRPCR